MTDSPPVATTRAWEAESGPAAWRLELSRSLLLPGRLVDGSVTIRARGAIDARGVVVNLVGEEHWRQRVTRTDSEGRTHTEVVTRREEHRRVPVQVAGPLRLAAGETWERSFQLPVPPLGPATLEARDAGIDWALEAKLDLEGRLDSRIEVPVVVAQPTALLRAGSVRVGAFGLYESADVAADGLAGSIELEPVPLVCGEPFSGRLRLEVPGTTNLQEVRAELRVLVEATVSEGESETVVAWAGQLAPSGAFAGALELPIAGTLGPRPLPTVELPHGRASATFHVILARAWATDPHLVRDVAIATTREL